MKNIPTYAYNSGGSEYFSFLPPEIVTNIGIDRKFILGFKPVGSDEVKSNSLFKDVVFDFCEKILAKHKYIVEESKEVKNSWIYVIDQRTDDSNPKPKDIIGAFEITNSEIVSFKPNRNYLVWTSDGYVNFGKEMNLLFYNYIVQLAQ